MDHTEAIAVAEDVIFMSFMTQLTVISFNSCYSLLLS